VAAKILHLARWIAWQIRELDGPVVGNGEARITVISGGNIQRPKPGS
jgi:hypothetical protein